MNQLKNSHESPVSGTSQLRREDVRLIAGQGRFVDDIAAKNALHVTFVRSMVGCGTLLDIDVSEAREAVGVIAVFTGEDVGGVGTLPVNPVLERVEVPDYPILAWGRVNAVGQPVVAIVSTTLAAGADAADLVTLTIDGEQAQVDCSSGLKDASVSGSWSKGNVAAAFEHASHIVEVSLEHPRLAPCALEPRAIVAEPDNLTGQLTVWLSTQTPHRSRQVLAELIGIEIDRLRLVAPDVGGAFGMKASLYPEEVLVAWAALKLGQTVRWTATRSEDFLAASHGRGAHTNGRLAVSANGQFQALSAHIACPLGHWLTSSAAIPAWNAGRILPGPYRIDNVDIATAGMLTNTAAVGIYRGAGRPEAAALMERLVDKAASATGLDPIEIRRRNLIASTAMPFEGPTGIVLDSGRYELALDELRGIADYEDRRRDIETRREAGEIVGLGIGFFVEPSGQGWESARVEIEANGSIIASTGGSTQGQGRETALATLVAGVFDVDPEAVVVRSGDSETCPQGIGALASRSTPIGGSAMLKAARQAKEKFDRDGGPVNVELEYHTEGEAWGYGCHLATISIDPDTGQVTVESMFIVDDIGKRLDTRLVEGQIVGGVAQGLGEAVMESLHYDENGQLLTGSLTDYALPRAVDMPDITTTAIETPSPFNLLGAKGVGEAGTIGAPAAILNAVHDALAPFGVEEIQMPLTSARVWQAINEARRRTKAK